MSKEQIKRRALKQMAAARKMKRMDLWSLFIKAGLQLMDEVDAAARLLA